VHKTADGSRDRLLANLENPFLGCDSKDYQVVQPESSKNSKLLGAKIIALEKIREIMLEYERAIMAIRFSLMKGREHSFIAEARSNLFSKSSEKKQKWKINVIATKGKVKFRANDASNLVVTDKILKNEWNVSFLIL